MKKITTLLLSLVLMISMVGCSSGDVATVNGEAIPFKYYKTYVNWTKQNYEASGYTSSVWETDMSTENSSGTEEKTTYWEAFKDEVLNAMIQSEVIYQEAKKVDALPTDEDIQKQIDSFNEYLDSDETAKEQAKKAGINDDFLEYVFTRELAYSTYQEYYTKKTEVEESKIKEEYEKYKDTYDTVTASHILISTKDSDGNELSDAKKAKAKAKAEEVLKKAQSGEDFAKLAKEYSEDGSNASNGGELGAFTYDEMVEEFSKAAFALEKGQISGIVETEFGYHIIKVTDKATTYEDAKQSVKSALLTTEFVEATEKLVEDAKIDKDKSKLKSINYK